MKENTIMQENIISQTDPSNSMQKPVGILKNITNKIINKALIGPIASQPIDSKKPEKIQESEKNNSNSDFTFSNFLKDSENQQENGSNFTFCESDQNAKPIPEKSAPQVKSTIRILDLLPSKIQEKYGALKMHVLGRTIIRFSYEKKIMNAYNKWKQATIKMSGLLKAKSAADTVEKMSKVSRSFIALNALGSFVNKKEAVTLCKFMSRWRANKGKIPEKMTEKNNDEDQKQGIKGIATLKLASILNRIYAGNMLSFKNGMVREYGEKKQKEINDLKGIVKQYGYWEQKINDIEGKLKSENEELLTKSQNLQSELNKLQELLSAKNKELVEKIEIIESLSSKLKENPSQKAPQKVVLEPVNEAICSRCKESMEQSINFGEKGISGAIQEEKIKEIMTELAKTQTKLLEKTESEKRIKKELEDQVDLVLKMEEERLLMLKETKNIKEQLDLLKQRTEIEKCEISIETEPILSEKAKEAISKSTAQPKSTKMAKTTHKTGKKSMVGSSKKKLVFEKPQKLAEDPSLSGNTSVSSLNNDLLTGSVIMPQADTKEALTQEIIKSNRENAKLKKELRAKEEVVKKIEKEMQDIKKQLVIKIDAVEKLRRENSEMAVTLQADQFKSVRLLETEKSQAISRINELSKKLNSTQQSKTELEQELENTKKSLENVKKRVEELEVKLEEYKEKAEKYDPVEHELIEKRESVKKLESEKIAEKTIKEQLVKEKSELEKKIEMLNTAAQNFRFHAEKATTDLESYSHILKNMEKKLIMTDQEKMRITEELKEIKERYIKLLNSK